MAKHCIVEGVVFWDEEVIQLTKQPRAERGSNGENVVEDESFALRHVQAICSFTARGCTLYLPTLPAYLSGSCFQIWLPRISMLMTSVDWKTSRHPFSDTVENFPSPAFDDTIDL